MLFHEIGRKILADTMVKISQNPGRAGRNKNTSRQVPTKEVSTRSENCADDVETWLVQLRRDFLEPDNVCVSDSTFFDCVFSVHAVLCQEHFGVMSMRCCFFLNPEHCVPSGSLPV